MIKPKGFILVEAAIFITLMGFLIGSVNIIILNLIKISDKAMMHNIAFQAESLISEKGLIEMSENKIFQNLNSKDLDLYFPKHLDFSSEFGMEFYTHPQKSLTGKNFHCLIMTKYEDKIRQVSYIFVYPENLSYRIEKFLKKQVNGCPVEEMQKNTFKENEFTFVIANYIDPQMKDMGARIEGPFHNDESDYSDEEKW